MFEFFAPTVRRVIGPFAAAAGFAEHASSSTRLTFARGDVALSFAYFLERVPEPWVAVELGLVDQGGLHCFGLWRVIPQGSTAAGYPTWRFSDPATLEAVLRRELDEVVQPYAVDLWGDRDRVAEVLSRQTEEAERRYLEDRRDADLLRARQAFDDGRFQDSIDAYVQVDLAALSASDRRRFHLARKRLPS